MAVLRRECLSAERSEPASCFAALLLCHTKKPALSGWPRECGETVLSKSKLWRLVLILVVFVVFVVLVPVVVIVPLVASLFLSAIVWSSFWPRGVTLRRRRRCRTVLASRSIRTFLPPLVHVGSVLVSSWRRLLTVIRSA